MVARNNINGSLPDIFLQGGNEEGEIERGSNGEGETGMGKRGGVEGGHEGEG